MKPLISVLVPIYNEEENIQHFFEHLFAVLRGSYELFEVIAVNDGSRDGSARQLRAACSKYPELKLVDLRRNSGQTAALMAGMDHASGEIIVMIDADSQNDPEDIPRLVAKLDEGYEVVSGWRKNRQDAALRRVFVSRVANQLISRISGVSLNDYGCTLKAYRRDVLNGVRLYGEMHRFIPIYASWMGARISELPVRHHPRRFGTSNYGLERVGKVLLDLLVVTFLDRYFVKPIYVFGGFGLISLLLSFASTFYMFYLKLIENISMSRTPLPLVATMTFLVGVVSILLGLLAEILVRTYFESQQRRTYSVKERLNFQEPD